MCYNIVNLLLNHIMIVTLHMDNNDMFTWLRLPNSKFGPVTMITEKMTDFNYIQMVIRVDIESRKHGFYFIFILVSKKVNLPL